MLKKLSLLLILAVFIIPTITKGETNTGTPLLEVGFCENGLERLDATIVKNVTPGTDFKICSVIKNNNDYDITVNLGFAVAVKNTVGQKACSAPKDTVYEFAKDGTIQEITIPANNNIVYEPILNIPVGVKGIQDMCFMFQEKKIKKTSNKQGLIVSVDSWKKRFMTFVLGDLSNLKNNVSIDNTKLYINQKNELILELIATGNGNVNNAITITSNVKNGLGWKSSGSNEGKIDNGGRTKIDINFGTIPSNGGLFQADFEIQYKPVFSFKTNPDDFKNGFLDGDIVKGKISLLKMPRIYIGIIIAIIFLLFLAFRKPKQKVVYVQQPQQPTPNV